MTAQPIQVLVVADSDDDARTMVRALRRGGYAVEAERVATADTFQQALARQDWDVILSDYALQRFDAFQALRLAKAIHREIPLIVVSGTRGEEAAIAAMKAGAADFLRKSRPALLAPAVGHVLRATRRLHRRAPAKQASPRSVEGSVHARRGELLRATHDLADGVAHQDTAADLRLVYEIGVSLTSLVVNEPQLLYTMLYEQVARRLFDAPHFVIAQYQADTRMITCEFAIVDNEVVDPALFPPRELGFGPISDSIREQRIVINNPLEIAKRAESKDRQVMIGDERIPQSGIYIPLIAGERLYGVMTMQHYEAGVFRAQDFALIATIANHVATALENAHLYRTVRSYSQNLEEHVRARTAELEQAKEWVESILSSTSDSIVLAEQRGNLIQANLAFWEQFQVEPESIAGKLLTEVIADSEVVVVMAAVDRALETASTVVIDTLCVRRDQSVFEAELSIAPLAYRGVNAPNVVCVIHDVTRHKQIESALRATLQQERELNELKLRFNAMVSHEFRTPLSVILSSAGMLRVYADRLTAEKTEAKLLEIENQVHRMIGLLDNILALSRAEIVQVAITKKPVNPSEFCRQVMEEIQQTTTSHRLELDIQGASRLVQLDPDLMGHLLRNLLSNAVKYSPAGTMIQLRCLYAPDELTLQVQDQGIGIPEDDLLHLFDAFHRAKNVHDISGTGLGLAIVKHAVEAHQGTITVESKVGVGTTFTVVLPTG